MNNEPISNNDNENVSDAVNNTESNQSVEVLPSQPTNVYMDNKINVNSVARLVLMVIALINNVIVMFGGYTIPQLPEDVTYIVASGLSIVMTLIVYWKNNSWTGPAKLGDSVIKAIKSSEVSLDDLINMLDALTSKTNHTNLNK